MTKLLLEFALNLLTIVQFFVFLAVVFSWFPQSRKHAFVQFVLRVVEPLFRVFPPIRIGILDLTPLALLLVIQLLQSLLYSYYQ